MHGSESALPARTPLPLRQKRQASEGTGNNIVGGSGSGGFGQRQSTRWGSRGIHTRGGKAAQLTSSSMMNLRTSRFRNLTEDPTIFLLKGKASSLSIFLKLLSPIFSMSAASL